MSTIVYQDILQSRLDSQIIETTTLNLKIPSSIELGRGTENENNIENVKEKCNYQVTNKSTTTNLDLGGWSSVQNLPNVSKESGVYVHPLSKKCSYFSEESLQLCTESLGSETGSDIIDTNVFSFSSSYSKIEKSTSPETKINEQPMMTMMTHPSESSSSSRNSKVIKSSGSNKNFPPPLTTIRGLNSVQFKPHREDGRLIIKAIESPLTHNYYQAERSNGRLRLCFFKNEISASDDTSDFDEIEDEIMENDITDAQEEEEETEDEDEEEEESDMHNLNRDADGNKFDDEAEMGKEKCQRLSRCKESGEGNKAFCDWRKPLWVATS